MPAMPLQAISLLFHAYVGWRLVPALGSVAGGALLALVLVVSALTLPFGLGARHGGTRRFGVPLAWIGLIGMGLFSSLFVLTFVRDLGLLAVAAVDAMRPGTLAYAPLLAAIGARRRDRRRAGHALGLRQRPPHRARRSRRRARRRLAARARRLHDRPDQRRPRRADDQASLRRGDRRPPSTASTSTSSPSPATWSTARCATSPTTSPRSPACARRRAASSSPATTSTTRAPSLGRRAAPARHRRPDERARRRPARRRGAGRRRRHRFRRRPLRPRPGQRSARRARRQRRRAPRCASCSRISRAAPRRPRRRASISSSAVTPTAASSCPGTSSSACSSRSPPGLHRWRRMWVYTSRGTGYWGPPKRIGAPSEITVLRLVGAPAASPAALPASPRAAAVAPGV